MANIKVNTVENGIVNIPVSAGSEYVIGEFALEGGDPNTSTKSKTCIKVTDINNSVEYYTINRLEYDNSDTYSRGIENAWNNGGFKQPGENISDAAKNAIIQVMLQDNLDKLVNSILLDGEARIYSEAMPYASGVSTINLKKKKASFLEAKREWTDENNDRKTDAQQAGNSEFRLTTGGILSVDTNIDEIAAFSCGDFDLKDPLQGPFKYMDVFASASKN